MHPPPPPQTQGQKGNTRNGLYRHQPGSPPGQRRRHRRPRTRTVVDREPRSPRPRHHLRRRRLQTPNRDGTSHHGHLPQTGHRRPPLRRHQPRQSHQDQPVRTRTKPTVHRNADISISRPTHPRPDTTDAPSIKILTIRCRAPNTARSSTRSPVTNGCASRRPPNRTSGRLRTACSSLEIEGAEFGHGILGHKVVKGIAVVQAFGVPQVLV